MAKVSMKNEAITMRTHKGLMAPGMPSMSRMRRISAAVLEQNPVRRTNHKRTTERPHANKAKQQQLREAHGGIAAGLLPQDGGNKKQVKPLVMTSAAGYFGYRDSSSLCRSMRSRKHSAIAVTWEDGTRRMNWNLPEIARPNYDKETFQPAAPEAMAQILGMENLYSASATASWYRSFNEAIYHPACTLTIAEKEVLSYLVEHGLFLYNAAASRWNSGKVHVSQATLCRDTGWCVDVVRAALRELAARGILKIVATRYAGSKHVSHEYVGICEWAETEKQRYDRCMAAIRATSDQWRLVMDRIHAETLRDWQDEGRQQKTFHAEFKQRLEAAGVPPDRVGQVIPSLG